MALPIAAAIMGGAALGQGLISAFGGEKAAAISAEAANKNTNKQLAWEREKFNTAHQAEMADLEKAGLNPILSAGGSGATAGGISPQLPDTSSLQRGYAEAGAAINSGIANIISAQQVKNDTDRVLNETKETNSNLSIKQEQILNSMEQRLNMAVERGLIKQKTATEIKNRAKLQSDIELARSQEFLNEQLRGKAEYEMKLLEQEIEQIKAELELHPSRKRAAELQNDLNEKENKVYYIRETVGELSKITAAGLSIYGAYQANQAISAYKANQNRPYMTEIYNGKGKQIGQRVSYYK